VTIDPKLLPAIALIDTGLLIRALGNRPDDPRSPDAKAFFKAMRDNRRLMLVAAPTFAEYLRGLKNDGAPTPFPRGPYLVVVPFDGRAAELMAQKFPASAMRARKLADSTTFQKEVWTYDAMIISCAVTHGAECIVGFDRREDFMEIVKAVNMPLRNPSEFHEPSLPILDVIEQSKANESPGSKPLSLIRSQYAVPQTSSGEVDTSD